MMRRALLIALCFACGARTPVEKPAPRSVTPSRARSTVSSFRS